MAFASYDSEDKELIPFDKIEPTVEGRYALQGYGSIVATDSRLAQPEEITFDLSERASIPVDPQYGGWHGVDY